MKAYLILYNLAACAGWAFVLYLTATSYKAGKSVFQTWDAIKMPLMIVQSSAALEIFHSLLGLVRSPLSSTFIQVMSRLVIIWGYTYWAKACHGDSSLLLMVGAWSMVEVPRYLFYTLNLIPAFSGKNMPSLLFALRYSLFMVLYPAGISGEILQILAALPFIFSVSPVLGRLAQLHVAAYVPLGPYMVLNMWHMRKRAYKKRNAESGVVKKTVVGLVWPVTNADSGERSTSKTNKLIWENAVASVDKSRAEKLNKVKNWRFGYVKHVEENVRACLESPENALTVARTGLAYAKSTFEFVRDEKTLPLSHVMNVDTTLFKTGFIQGEASKPAKGFKLVVPYKEKNLEGLELLAQLDKWVASGTIEESAGEAIKTCVRNPEWMDLSDRYFVLLGATSAMGPLNALLGLGANIVAIDLDRAPIWKDLITRVRNSCGSITFPLKKSQDQVTDDDDLFANAGANLLTMTPEIAKWVAQVHPNEALTIGNYTYLDGGLHVQLSLSCDCIIEEVCAKRKNTSIAFLCTPTDVHCIPKAAHTASAENYKNVPQWQKLIESITGNLKKNPLQPVAKSGLYLVDGIVANQGPNYALAKRIQHWRAVIAHSEGHVVSSNIAPSTATKSVVSNPQFAAAYGGFHLFKSMEVMYQDTSSAVMLALLVNDIRNDSSVANPKNKIKNPFELFASNSFHGGVWRCPYKVGTIGVTSAVYFYLTTYKLAVVGTIASIYGAVNYVIKGSPV